MIPKQLKYMKLKIPKSWILLAVFIVSVMGAGAWVFTTPPDGKTNQTGIYFGNNSMNGNNVTSDRIDVMNYFGSVVGTYLDSYSCNGAYCVYNPWYDSGKTYAKNMSTGKIDYSGTNTVSVINQALINLTPRRTWKETVVLKGNFSGTKNITVWNYTILDMTQAKFTLNDNSNGAMIVSGDPTSTESVDIVGGVLDGNGKNQALSGGLTDYTGVYGIDLRYPKNSSVVGTTILNVAEIGLFMGISPGTLPTNSQRFVGNDIVEHVKIYGTGLTSPDTSGKCMQFNGIINLEIKNNIVQYCLDQGIQTGGAYNVKIYNNNVSNTGDMTTRGGGIWAHYGSEYVTVRDNIIINTTQHGIFYLDDGNIVNPYRGNLYDHNVIRNTTKSAIGTGIRIDYGNMTIINNDINDTYQGILINMDAGQTDVANIDVIKNKIGYSSNVGIILYKSQASGILNNIRIEENTIDVDSGPTGLYIGGGKNIRVNNNNITGVATNSIIFNQGSTSYLNISSFQSNTFDESKYIDNALVIFEQLNNWGNRTKAPSIHKAGDVFYNWTSKAYNVWNGATWQYQNGTYVNQY